MLKSLCSYALLIACSLFFPKNQHADVQLSFGETITASLDDMNMISIYPNPLTGDVMNLKAPRNTGFVVLYNEDGKKVFRENFEAGTNTYDISDVEPGTYDVSIITDGSLSVAKFEICRW